MSREFCYFVMGRLNLPILHKPFGKPELLDIKGRVPEGPSITYDGKILYYHKKDGQYFKIYKMTRVL